MDKSQERLNQHANDCAEETSPGELSKEPYMDDVGRLLNCRSEELTPTPTRRARRGERERELDHMATDHTIERVVDLVVGFLLMHR